MQRRRARSRCARWHRRRSWCWRSGRNEQVLTRRGQYHRGERRYMRRPNEVGRDINSWTIDYCRPTASTVARTSLLSHESPARRRRKRDRVLELCTSTALRNGLSWISVRDFCCARQDTSGTIEQTQLIASTACSSTKMCTACAHCHRGLFHSWTSWANLERAKAIFAQLRVPKRTISSPGATFGP